MACPYCGSRKKAEEYTVRTYSAGDEWVGINEIQCAKCREFYSETVRNNIRTGKRRVTVSGAVRSCGKKKGLVKRLFGRD